MDIFTLLVEFVLHLDQYIGFLIQTFGIWTYVILFIVVFCETGLVVAPFLPGDSLLFAAGAFAALGSLDFALLFASLAAAAIIGDTVNYWLGHYVGPKVFTKKNVRFMNRAYLERAHRFYEKHGGKTIVLARFIPIIRTFAPFVAGIGAMNYRRFIVYNILGAVAWVAVFLTGGYLFGNIPSVRENFALVMIAIIAISFAPLVFELIRRRMKARGKKTLKDSK
ncbi:MAG: DedA family protein [Candidatus Aenigmatarchaeota archaeon]